MGLRMVGLGSGLDGRARDGVDGWGGHIVRRGSDGEWRVDG